MSIPSICKIFRLSKRRNQVHTWHCTVLVYLVGEEGGVRGPTFPASPTDGAGIQRLVDPLPRLCSLPLKALLALEVGPNGERFELLNLSVSYPCRRETFSGHASSTFYHKSKIATKAHVHQIHQLLANPGAGGSVPPTSYKGLRTGIKPRRQKTR